VIDPRSAGWRRRAAELRDSRGAGALVPECRLRRAMIRLEGARVGLGAFALSVDALGVGRGEYLVLLGPSGAGKSVLLELVAGLRRLDEGCVLIDGDDVTEKPPEERRIGLVSQRPSLFPHMSVRGNIEFGRRYQKVTTEEFARRVETAVAMLDLEPLLSRSVTDLSGGEAQRVTLARALVTEPRVLLLDEPLGPLDENMRADLAAELRRVHDSLGITTMHVTHDQTEARSLADRVAVMERGTICQIGTVEDVWERPACEFVARFVGQDRGPRTED
jgi:ABC-type sugar transport system ATPase subunit